MSLSLTVIAGNMGRDPQVRDTSNGKKVCSFSVAVNGRGKVDGRWQKTTEWYSVTCFGQTAEFIGEHGTKGRTIICVGEVRINSYVNKSGEKVSNLEMTADRATFIGPRGDTFTAEAKPAADFEEVPF